MCMMTQMLLTHLLLPLALFQQGPQRTDDRPPSPGEQENTRVVPLQHTDPRDVGVIVGQAIRPLKAIADARTNSLIVTAAAQEMDRAMQLIKALDVESKGRGGAEIEVLQLRHRDAEHIARRLSEVLVRIPVQIAADAARSAVLVNGPALAIEQAKAIVERLDTPEVGAQIEFAVLYAGAPESRDSDGPQLAELASPVPADLADVARELSRFGTIRMLGRMSTAAIEDQKFSLEGHASGALDLQIEGRLLSSTPGGAVRLELNAAMIYVVELGPAATTGPARSVKPMFKLATAVTANRGDTVVLGTAPTGWKPGESAILVVKIAK